MKYKIGDKLFHGRQRCTIFTTYEIVDAIYAHNCTRYQLQSNRGGLVWEYESELEKNYIRM